LSKSTNFLYDSNNFSLEAGASSQGVTRIRGPMPKYTPDSPYSFGKIDIYLLYWVNNTIIKINFISIFRSGFKTFADMSTKRNIPFLIFSAGLQDTIVEIIKQQNGGIAENAHIVANKLIYDRNDVAIDYETPVIHSYKKGVIPQRFGEVIAAIKVSSYNSYLV